MSMKSPKDVYNRLATELVDETVPVASDEMTLLQGLFMSQRPDADVYVITLDEIDHLLTLDLETLYMLFEWSMQRHSKLILIGIANALDLTDRFLPRLKARNLKPHLLPFLPYTAPQIDSVLTCRLRSLLHKDTSTDSTYVPFVHPTAISLCSRKVASQTGDLRKAFEMSRRAIDLVESETKQKFFERAKAEELQTSPSKGPLTDNMNLSSPSSSRTSPKKPASSHVEALLALTAETAPRATVAHIARIASAAFGNGTTQRLQSLNLQQKAALCALVALERRKRAAMADLMATPSKTHRAAPTVRMLYETYASLCTRDRILHPLTSTEFRDVIGSLETLSLISAVDGKNGSFSVTGTPSKRRTFGGMSLGGVDERRVASCVAETELEQAVEGVGAGILKGILKGEGLD
jgi:cell division control protein 6